MKLRPQRRRPSGALDTAGVGLNSSRIRDSIALVPGNVERLAQMYQAFFAGKSTCDQSHCNAHRKWTRPGGRKPFA